MCKEIEYLKCQHVCSTIAQRAPRERERASLHLFQASTIACVCDIDRSRAFSQFLYRAN